MAVWKQCQVDLNCQQCCCFTLLLLACPEELCLIAPHRQDGFESQVVGFVVSAFLAHFKAVVALNGVVRVLGKGEGGCRSALGCVALIWWMFLIGKLLANERWVGTVWICTLLGMPCVRMTERATSRGHGSMAFMCAFLRGWDWVWAVRRPHAWPWPK